MNPIAFQQKWTGVELKERSAAQEHFLDLCAMLGHQTPAQMDRDGTTFTFERGAAKSTGGQGWADVWYRGHFAWEYKGPHKDLVKAYDQLLRYKDDLENPPLLIVSDLDRIEIHTNFTGTVKHVHVITLETITDPASLHNWLDPEGAPKAELKKRTLTNLDNQRPTWLRHAHERLDRAVWAAYGWDDPDPAIVDEDTILARLLALNGERAGLRGRDRS